MNGTSLWYLLHSGILIYQRFIEVIAFSCRKDSGQEPSQSRWRPYLKYIIIVAVFLIVVAIATVTIVLIANRVDGSASKFSDQLFRNSMLLEFYWNAFTTSSIVLNFSDTSTVPNVSSTVAKSTITTRGALLNWLKQN